MSAAVTRWMPQFHARRCAAPNNVRAAPNFRPMDVIAIFMACQWPENEPIKVGVKVDEHSH